MYFLPSLTQNTRTWDYWNVCTILKHLFKSCFSLKGSTTARFKVRSKKQTNAIFTSPSDRYELKDLSASFSLGIVTAGQCLEQGAGIRVYNPFKFTGQTGKEGKCQKLQIKQLILKGNEACKWIIFRHAVSDFLNICHSCKAAQHIVVNLRTCLKCSHEYIYLYWKSEHPNS